MALSFSALAFVIFFALVGFMIDVFTNTVNPTDKIIQR
jgi:hypothetical protein